MANKFASIPDGRYALTFSNKVTRFLKVEQGKGKWAGATFVTLLVANGGHGVASLAEYKISAYEKRQAVLALILANPEGASKKFGEHIGACGVCGRILTDEASRAAGIGPVCAGKMGW